MKHSTTWWFLGRIVLYTVLIFVFMLSLKWILLSWGDTLFEEHGPLQWIQFVVLFIAALMMAIGARRLPSYRELLWVLACMLAFAAVREQDDLLDKTIPFLGWKVAGIFVVLAFGVMLSRKAAFMEQLATYGPTAAFAIFWAGLIVAVPVAQLMGHGPFLEILLGYDYNRTYKAALEESGEMVGYMLLVAGSIETLYWVKKTK